MCRVLVEVGGLLSCSSPAPLVAAHVLLSCDMRTLSCGMHVGSSSLTRDRTQAPCIGMWILKRCATREVPGELFLNVKNLVVVEYFIVSILYTIKNIQTGGCQREGGLGARWNRWRGIKGYRVPVLKYNKKSRGCNV